MNFAPATSEGPPGIGLALKQSPPISLPLRHFAFSAISFWVFSAAFLWGSGRLLGFGFDAKWVLGLVHILTLGWITMTILGVLTQMASVLLDVPLYSPRLSAVAWWLLAIGIVGFIGHLWGKTEEYWIPAVLIVCAVIIYLYILVRTILSAPVLDWSGKHLAISLGYLALVAVLGLLLAYDRERGIILNDPEGTLIAHVHLALIGWVSIAIFGASYKLVSMFALAHVESRTSGRIALWLINSGLLGLVSDCLFFGRRWMPLWAVLLACSYIAYVIQMRQIFSRRIRKLGPSLSFTLTALAGGLIWAGLGLALVFGWLEDSTASRSAYIFTALIGWVTPYILGQIYKIVPFLVWLHLYHPLKLKPGEKILQMGDLSSDKLAWGQLLTFIPVVPLGIAGFLKESNLLLLLCSIFLFISATLYLINFIIPFTHLFREVKV